LNDKFPYCVRLTPSIIEDDVIIGGCVTVLPNVTIGKGSVVAAGSAVTKDVSPESVVSGIPAKPMMTRQEYENKKKAFIGAKKL
jgi:acetyltransferase-like isoleucine patch superfamily enzyme